MARIPTHTVSSGKVARRPDTPAGNAQMARDHAKLAAHHAQRSQQQHNDTQREAPRSRRSVRERAQ